MCTLSTHPDGTSQEAYEPDPSSPAPGEAHLTIVFTALAVSREVRARTGFAIRNVIRQLRPLRSATIAINGAVQTFPPDVPNEKQEIVNALPESTPRTNPNDQTQAKLRAYIEGWNK